MSVQFSVTPAQAPVKLWLHTPGAHCTLIGVPSDRLGEGNGAEATSVLMVPGR